MSTPVGAFPDERTGTLTVGNSVAATTVGAVSGKYQVYDINGVSLGFVPIYATIT